MTSKIRYTYRGLIVPVFTPFKSNSERALNTTLIPRYSDYLKSKNMIGVLANGTTGEGMTMSVKERKEVAEAWSDSAKRNGQHLVVQVGGAPVSDVKELAKHAQSINANAILCLPELYYRPSNPEELIDYVKTIGEAAPDTPLLYYHYPNMSKVEIHMGKFLEAVGNRIPNLVGIKFTSTNLEEGSKALRVDNRRFAFFLGSNELIPSGCASGVDSFMMSGANLFPDLVQSVISSCKKDDFSSAKFNQEKLLEAFRKFSHFGQMLPTMKAAMFHLSPIDVGPSRKPLPSYDSETDQIKLRNLLKSLN